MNVITDTVQWWHNCPTGLIFCWVVFALLMMWVYKQEGKKVKEAAKQIEED